MEVIDLENKLQDEMFRFFKPDFQGGKRYLSLPASERPVILTGMLVYERYSVSNGTLSLGIICLDFAENERIVARDIVIDEEK